MKIVVVEHLTLDGVMQSPGGPEEDPRGGFRHGGWATDDNDDVMNQTLVAHMAQEGSLLLGRFTYEAFFATWPKQKNNPYTEILTQTQKFVPSRTLKAPLPWENSTLLPGDATESVSSLKHAGRHDRLVVLGSGVLVQSLLKAGLVDELLLMIHPVILGSGRRLFPDGDLPTRLRLVDGKTTTKGVVIATYQPRI